MKNLKKLISVDLSSQRSEKKISNWGFYILYFIFFFIFYFGTPSLLIGYLFTEFLMNGESFLTNLEYKIGNLVSIIFLTFAAFYIAMSVMFIDLRISPWRLRFKKNQTKIKSKQQPSIKSFFAMFKNSFGATVGLLIKFMMFVVYGLLFIVFYICVIP